MPVHTDRDQRIKVQFHWQRGASGSHRLDHPTGDDNAPTSDASGTWVRVDVGATLFIETQKDNKLQEWLARCHFGNGSDKYPDAETHVEQYRLALAE